jgi:hypothetical protein
MSTLKLVNLQHQSSNTPALVLDANNLVTVTGNLNVSNSLVVTGNTTFSGSVNFNTDIVPTSSFKRNRIINGNMVIDQRNAGAAITANTGAYFTVDRWALSGTQASKFTAQQNAGSVTTPVGFPNYLGMTVASAVTVGSSDIFSLYQPIEGYNFADLGFGTYNAKTVTLSFVVYSSLTGTFGGVLKNYAGTRTYAFTYSISSANTWTTVSVTIPGDTSGTWVGSSSAGVAFVQFGLGVGSTYSGTAGSWASANYSSATGAVSVVGTAGATWYVTGVQLEVGAKATPYEYQTYSEQLAQCQRYYVQWTGNSSATGYAFISNAVVQGSGLFFTVISLPVSMRSTPSISTNGTITGSPNAGTLSTITNIYTQQGSTLGVYGTISVTGTQGYAFVFYTYNASTSYFALSSEI